ncbi:MAG: lipopolysaccharide biosynthesis protein [Steroidobacteraceae bacterium]
MGLANRAIVLTVCRMTNYGLMLVSPIILVRLFSVAGFGRYREFLLYAGILQSIAAFSIPDSLLYFVAANPDSPWRVVKRSAVLTLVSTGVVALALLVGNAATHGALVGPYAWPLAAYTLFSVNLDFWECFWVARRRPFAVFAYSTGRLAARLTVVIVVAVVTRSVWAILWALVIVEALRLAASAVALRRLGSRAPEPPLAEPWAGFLRFCVPFGMAAVLALFSRNLSPLTVTKLLGTAALAQYMIGRFGEPIVTTVRNSISAVVLPEMVRRGQARESPLALWRQATVVNALCLFPIAVLVARYALPLIRAVFGASYAPAAPVMQIYMIVVLRECLDFGPALRAAGRTAPLVVSNVASLLSCGALLVVLAPRYGIAGAMLAFAIASLIEAGYLAGATLRTYRITLSRLLPWRSLSKVGLACGLASFVLLAGPLSGLPVLLSIAIAGAAYLAVYALIVYGLRVPEALALVERARRVLWHGAMHGA